MASLTLSRPLTACAGLALLLATGCGDDTAPPTTDGSSSGDTSDTPPGDTTTSSTTDTTTTGVADSSSSGDPLPPLEVEAEIHTYPNQPMVVDLSFSEPGLTIEVEHETDDGIRVAALPDTPDGSWVRVRGLAPEAGHIMRWMATDELDRTVEGDLLVTTETALPGFVPSFPIEGSGVGYGGYVLFDLLGLTPEAPSSLFVVDTEGVTRWHVGRADQVVGPPAVFAGAKLREDGSLLYLRDYSVFIIDEMGTEQLAVTSAQLGLPGLHHDVIELESGNFLALSYTFRDIDYPDIGLTHVAGDLIVEFTPEGDLVWEWDAFDHLDPLRRRDGFDDPILDPDTLEIGNDWTHGNGITHDPATDTVLFSMRHQDWVINIDRGTGDVLWRLGEEGDFMMQGGGTWSFHQHSPEWQEDGTLLLYDNGLANPGLPDDQETSRAVRYALDTEAMTATQAWEDEAEDFVSPIAGDADRLPDGSILVTDSSIGLDQGFETAYARIREIDERTSGTPQWSLTTELGTFVYRCTASALLPGEQP